MTRSQLIKRLWKAKRGSRELSDAMLLACGWEKRSLSTSGQLDVWFDSNRGIWYDDKRPSPTESVDDGLRLVMQGASAAVTQHGSGRGSTELYAYISQVFALTVIKMDVGGAMQLKTGDEFKWRKGQFLVFRERTPIGILNRNQIAREKSRQCNLPDTVIHHQHVGAATPALSLCLAILLAMEERDAS